MKKKKHYKHKHNHYKQKPKKREYGFEDEDYGVEFGYDDDYSFIAGFTAGGMPYGTTWEEDGIDTSLPFEERFKLLDEKYSSKNNDTNDELADLINELFY